MWRRRSQSSDKIPSIRISETATYIMVMVKQPEATKLVGMMVWTKQHRIKFRVIRDEQYHNRVVLRVEATQKQLGRLQKKFRWLPNIAMIEEG